MKIIISGGGTGGHIYPGIAIADAIKTHCPTASILFVGAEGKMEMEKVPKSGYEIIGLPIRGLQRSLSAENLKFPFRLVSSLNQARKIIKNFAPDVVVGTGGYASGAVVQVAALMNIPTLIQEQNGYAGLTNKLLAKQVCAICVAYPNMEKYFPKDKILFTGNPVRSDLQNLGQAGIEDYKYFKLSAEKPTVLVMGGSGGAKVINESILEGLQTLLDHDVQIIWQTGKFYLNTIQEKLVEKGFLNTDLTTTNQEKGGLWVNDFIYDMQKAYKCANVVVGRAGALTISELALAEKPSILIPSPNVAEDHQTKNAMALAKENAAMLIKDNETKERLILSLIYLLNNKNEQEKLKKGIANFAKPQAAQEIAQKILTLVH